MKKHMRFITNLIFLITSLMLISQAVFAAAPAAPKLVSARAASTTSVKLIWEETASAEGYAVLRSESRKTGYKTLKKIDSNATLSYTDNTVSKGKTYYYRVRAYAKDGSKTLWSKYSNILSVKVATTSKKKTQDSFAQAAAEMAKKNDAGKDVAIVDADPYGSARLIVKGKKSGISFDKYNPTQVIEGPDYVYIIQFGTAAAAKKACTKIKKLSTVVYAEPDEYASVLGFQNGEPVKEVPVSAIADYDSQQDNFVAMSGQLSWGATAVRSSSYASSLKGKGSITVAVIDSGVGSHSFINSRVLSGGYDYVDNDTNPRNDGHGHGTHVSGIIVDNTPGLKVKILPVRVLNNQGSGSMFNIANGVYYAVRKGAKVINMSLGGGHSSYLDDAINYAIRQGAVVVIASGNQNMNTSSFCPAHVSGAITVGATDSYDTRASFSNYGSAVDVSAPGVSIYSTIPNGYYASWDGTSMAAPFVAAAAAMYRLDYPSRTPAQIQSLIRSNVRDLGSSGWDQYYGTGRIQLPTKSGGSGSVKPTSVRISRSSATITVGDTLNLYATVYPVTAGNKSVTWSTSKSSVATVSAGKVKGKKAGTATITVKTSNGKTAKCKVTVKAKSSSSAGKTVTLRQFSSSSDTAGMRQYASAVRKGTTTLLARKGYAKFTAPSAGTYTFTYSNLRTKGVSGQDFNLGYIMSMASNGGLKRWMSGNPSVRIGSSYAASSSWPKSASGKLALQKGETVYLYHDLGFGNTMSYVKLVIK